MTDTNTDGPALTQHDADAIAIIDRLNSTTVPIGLGDLTILLGSHDTMVEDLIETRGKDDPATKIGLAVSIRVTEAATFGELDAFVQNYKQEADDAE